MADNTPDRAQIVEALKRVQDPEIKRDLVTLGMISRIEAADGAVSVAIEVATPTASLKETLERDVRRELQGLDGVREVNVDWVAPTRKAPAGGGDDLVPGVTHTIVIGSGKGGVGKSTVTTNLALALAATGARVGLFDADMYGPNQPLMLGAGSEPPKTEGKRILPVEVRGIKLISMGFFLKLDEAVIWRGPMLHGAVRQFLGDVEWGELDYLLVDLPPGTGDIQLTLAQLVPLTGAVLVTTPQEVALQDVRKAHAMFKKVKVPVLGMVENMSGYECRECGHEEPVFGEGGGERAAQNFGIPMLGRVPLDPRVMRGGDRGLPVVAEDPESPAAVALREVADQLASRVRLTSYLTGNVSNVAFRL